MLAGKRFLQPHSFRLFWSLLLSTCLLLACKQGEGTTSTASALNPATRPVDAIYVLRDRLLARDGAGFAELAVPPQLHQQLVTAWVAGDSRWPLDELPLDARIPQMLSALQAEKAESTLMTSFRKQFANADSDIDQAIRTLIVFGTEYIFTDPEYHDNEREHIAQAMTAIGQWAIDAPLSDPQRAQPFFSALIQAANQLAFSGNDADAFPRLGMHAMLEQLSSFFTVLLAQLHQQYGLDMDAALRSVQVSLQAQTGDHAVVRLQYTLAGTAIDALIPVVRMDGHWYVADYVQRAEQSTHPSATISPE
jgi:hypothetical protein